MMQITLIDYDVGYDIDYDIDHDMWVTSISTPAPSTAILATCGQHRGGDLLQKETPLPSSLSTYDRDTTLDIALHKTNYPTGQTSEFPPEETPTQRGM